MLSGLEKIVLASLSRIIKMQKVWVYENIRMHSYRYFILMHSYRYFILEMDDGYRWSLYIGREDKLIKGEKVDLGQMRYLYPWLKLKVI